MKMSNRNITIISLFDGISCGREAIRRITSSSNIRYFASEINQNAITVSKSNFPDIIQLGDIRTLSYAKEVLTNSQTKESFNVGNVFLLLAGSPCQGFSKQGSQSTFMHNESRLYAYFLKLLKAIKPKYVLLENVVMPSHCEDKISKELSHVMPTIRLIKLNSKDWSAQNRERLYWTNIPVARFVYPGSHPRTMRQLVGPNYAGIYARPHGYFKGGFFKDRLKSHCVVKTAYLASFFKIMKDGSRITFTPEEIELLQTLPKGYTRMVPGKHSRVELIGNGWTVALIQDILRNVIPP